MWVEIRAERGDLLMEHHRRDRLPLPGERVGVAGEYLQILNLPARTERREDELEGIVPVQVLTGHRVVKGSNEH